MEQNDLQELNRNMDTVFDAIRVLNAAVSAMVKSLDPAAAATFACHMDEAIDALAQEQNPLGISAHQQIHSWRNQAGSFAGLPVRRPGS